MSRGSKDEKDLPQTLIETLTKPNGEMVSKTYIRGKFLGKGGFARVYEVLCTESDTLYACKFIPKSKILKTHAKQKLMSEIKIHRFLHHENVVQFFHFFEDEEYVFILLELCRNHSLNELLRRRKRLTEIEAQSYLLRLISALQYLHAHRVIHRDIKLANIFITEKMEIKLGDFGLAAILEYEGERKRTICGTPNYIAPEILEGKCGHSYECDVWSFGVLLYTMLIGRPPFETKEVKTTYRRIKMNLYTFPENIEVSREAKNLISSILILDFKKRPVFDEILNHEFFTKNLIPKSMPQSSLAVPPSQGFLRKYENKEIGERVCTAARASSHETKQEPDNPSPLKLRTLSRDPPSRRSSEPKKDIRRSSYNGNDNEGPAVWISQWIDYSKKYGIGYMMSNNNVGAYFNDNTKIINDSSGKFLQYISTGKTGEIVSNFTIDEFPPEIHKKVMLLHLFKKQFLFDPKNEAEMERPLTYLKKWVLTPHAIIFRISNKIIQICFRDSTELVLSSESKHVTYIDKKKNINSYKLNEAMECGNKEMTKRLKYSKEILIKMLKEGDKD